MSPTLKCKSTGRALLDVARGIGDKQLVLINTMTDVAPGTTPLAFGNWKEAYVIVNRMATTLVTDPFSDGFCTYFVSRVVSVAACFARELAEGDLRARELDGLDKDEWLNLYHVWRDGYFCP